MIHRIEKIKLSINLKNSNMSTQEMLYIVSSNNSDNFSIRYNNRVITTYTIIDNKTLFEELEKTLVNGVSIKIIQEMFII